MENNLKLKTFISVLGLGLVCIASLTDMSNYWYLLYLLPALIIAFILTFLPKTTLQKLLSSESLIAIFLIIIGLRAVVSSNNVWQVILGGVGALGISLILIKELRNTQK